MKQSNDAKKIAWLKTNPPLEELCAIYPEEWATVQQDISAIIGRGAPEELQEYLKKLSAPAASAKPSHTKQLNKKNAEATLSQFVRSRMAHDAVKKLCLSTLAADTGVTKGKLRFNLFNGYIAQKLLFSKGLERKPVSLFWFRLLWPLLWQKKRLMPLVQPKGIYCFYSRELIEALSEIIGSKNCLEIGAGDGTLSRFLKNQGVQITATDNYSWDKAVSYSDQVIKLDAREALNTYTPEAVICSWPPSQNDFERQVFNTSNVQLYIVIGSRHQFAFGNWSDYRKQTFFDIEENKKMNALVLPPELESAVYVFRRKTPDSLSIGK
jgi:hypothetical protein